MKKVMAGMAAALIALPSVIVSAALPETDAVHAGLRHIATTQQADGGFGGFGPGQTMDAVFAIRAAGVDPNTVETDGNTPADYLTGVAGGLASAGEAAKGASAAVALGLDPRNVGGVDLVAVIEGAYDDGTGAYAGDDFSQAIIVLGLAAAGADVPPAALDVLRAHQLDDGGWGFGVSDPDTTAIVLQALLAGGGSVSEQAAVDALAYFRTTQNGDAGWGYDGESNPASTAFAVQALIEAGENPESVTYSKSGATPISYLVSMQNDDGSFPGFDPAYATMQVVPALAGVSYAGAPTAPVTLPGIPTATATAPATTAPATVTPTVKGPLAPNTGAGQAAGEPGAAPFIVIGGAVFAALGGGLAFAARRR